MNQQRKFLEQEYSEKLNREIQKAQLKAEQNLREFEYSQSHKRNESSGSPLKSELETRLKSQIRDLAQGRLIYLKEIEEELREYRNILRQRCEMNKIVIHFSLKFNPNQFKNIDASLKGELEALRNEIGMLTSHSIEKEAFLSKLNEMAKDLGVQEREIYNQEEANHQMQSVIKKAEASVSDYMQQMYGYQAKIQRLQLLVFRI